MDDDEQMRQALARRFGCLGMAVTTADSGEEALVLAEAGRFDVALLDLNLPGISGIEVLTQLLQLQPELETLMLAAHGSIETAIQAMRQGAYDYLTRPFQSGELEVHVHKAFEKVQLARREHQWVEQLNYESARYRLVGSSKAMQKVVAVIGRVAPTEAIVLVRGASGTGKELVARALHTNSPRRTRPLVTVNCAALQETLLESEYSATIRVPSPGRCGPRPGWWKWPRAARCSSTRSPRWCPVYGMIGDLPVLRHCRSLFSAEEAASAFFAGPRGHLFG